MLTSERVNDTYLLRNQVSGIAPPAARASRTYGVSDTWQLVRRYWRFLLAFMAVGTILSFIVLMSITETYSASSAIVFDRNDTRPYEAVVEAQKQERDKSAMETELDIIRSRVFVGLVVDALKLTEDPYYNTYLPPAEVKSDSWVRSRWNSAMRLLFGDGQGKSRQKRVISENAQRDRAITTLLNSYTVDRKGESLAMTIKVEQADPARAAEIADAIAEQYVNWASSLKEVATNETVGYLREQAREVALSIAKKEREIAAFTAVSDLTFEPKDDLLRARMEQLNEQFTLARVDEAGAWAKVTEVKQRLNTTGEDGAGKVVTSELLTSLRTEEARLERLRAQLTSKFGKNHPLVVDADAELKSNRGMITDEAARILLELENTAKVATVRVNKFENEVNELQTRMKGRNLAEIRRRELERDLLTEQKRYDAVVLRLNTLNPEQQEVKATASVASFAEIPDKPSFPQPIFLLAAGIVGSAILAILFMIILDALDDRLHRPEGVEELLKRPNLLRLPDYKKGLYPLSDPYSMMLRNPDSAFAKAIRSLCLAWRTIDGSTGGKVVMFASTSMGDGKTTLSLSMAAMAKSNGLRTLVVDLNPSDHGAAKIAGITLPDGALDKYLNGKGELKDVLTLSPNYPFLEMVVARLAMQDYERFFSSLRDSYDLVIVDTPSIDESDDAVWLSSYVDSIFIVVSASRTKQRRLSEFVERLNLNHALLIGSVMNYFGKPKVWRIPSSRRARAKAQPAKALG